MKKLFFGAFALSLFSIISCTDKKTSSETSSSSISETNRMRNSTVYRGIETGDMSKVDDFIAEDIVDHGMMGDIHGRDSVKAMLADVHNHFSNLKLESIAEATSADNQYHFALVRTTGTTTTDKMGMPVNTAVDQMSVDVVRIKDDKAVEHWVYDDPRIIMKMMETTKNMTAPNMSAGNKGNMSDTMSNRSNKMTRDTSN
jgi:predicted SnoaL-like aldol condensation-catalyzing enzyme